MSVNCGKNPVKKAPFKKPSSRTSEAICINGFLKETLFIKKQVSDQKIYLKPSCICHRDGRSGLAWKVLVREGSN